MNSEHDRPRCPSCGTFVSNLDVRANDERLTKVAGTCKRHGEVTLGSSWWSWDLYTWGDE